MSDDMNESIREAFTKYATSPDCKCEVCKAAHERQLVFAECAVCGYNYTKYAEQTGKVDPRLKVMKILDELADAGWNLQKPVKRASGMVIEATPPIDHTNMTKIVFGSDKEGAYVIYVDREGWMTGEPLEGKIDDLAKHIAKVSSEMQVGTKHDVPDGFLSIYTKILG